jgi:hypothetical protein
MRSISHALLAAILALLVACGSPVPNGGASQPATPMPSVAPTIPAAPTASASPDAGSTQQPASGRDTVVVFHRSGGIAGVNETLTVYADGRLEWSSAKTNKSGQAMPAELAALQKLLSNPEFAALDPRYQAAGADLFVYEIMVPNAGKPRQIVTMDGANNPPILDQLLEQLGKLEALAR